MFTHFYLNNFADYSSYVGALVVWLFAQREEKLKRRFGLLDCGRGKGGQAKRLVDNLSVLISWSILLAF
jgi:hypothetical protein